MKKVYNITITLLTPLHINAGTGADSRRVFVKTGSKPYIPATLLKGIMRSSTEQLIRSLYPDYVCSGKDNADSDCSCILCTLFGKSGFKPSRIVLDNLLTDSSAAPQLRTNLGLNRFTRRAQNKNLVSSEVAAAGTVFRGQMTVYYTDALKKYEPLLISVLENIDSIGSAKSRGLGLVKTEVCAL